MRRILAIAAVVLVTSSIGVSPVRAGAGGDSGLEEAFELLGFSGEQVGELGAATVADATGDGITFPPNQASEPHDEPVADIGGYGDVIVDFVDPAFGPEGEASFPCGRVVEGEGAYICAGDTANLSGPVAMLWFDVGAPVPLTLENDDTTYNLNFATFTDGATRWDNSGEFEFDTFRGTNRWHEAILTSAGWRLTVSNVSIAGSEGVPVPVESRAFALVHGRVFVLMIPLDELALDFDAPASSSAGNAAGATAGSVRILGRGAVVDAWLGYICSVKRLLLAARGVSVMDSCADIFRQFQELITPSGRRISLTSGGEDGASTPPPDGEGGDGGDGFPWPVVAIPVVALGAGFGLVAWRRRRRPVPDCDWAAYYDDGTQLVQLRKPQAHECCKYIVKVNSTVTKYGFASKGRQAPDRLDDVEEAPEGRLRIFDHDATFANLDIATWVAARSGPFGRLDWMQADEPANGPLPKEPNESYRWQFRSHEEEPDVAAHIEFGDVTKVNITLEPGCPDWENTYTANGESKAFVQASHECSNREPGPECPVELTAVSLSTAKVTGDLTYSVEARAGGDVDEVEGHAGLDVREVNGETFYGSHVDSHDHDTRAAETSEKTFTGKGTSTVKQKTYNMAIAHNSVADAGSIVPARVWDTTDEVSVDSYVDFFHDVSVDAKMVAPACAAGGGCGGHGNCACAPNLKLVFDGTDAYILCDGKQWDLSRPTSLPFGPPGVSAPAVALPGMSAPWDINPGIPGVPASFGAPRRRH